MNAAELNIDYRILPLIVVIDDNEFFRNSITKILANEFVVAAFESPTEALMFSETHLPYAILLDANMPNIDGFQALNLLRSHPATSSVPIVCISSTDKEEIRQRLISHGATGFMLKPFQADRLANDIRGLVTSLNKTLISEDGNRKFSICYSDQEKQYLMKQHLSDCLENNERVVILSWVPGNDFIPNNALPFVEKENLIYLQMKPQLIVKFPYLTEVSSVIHDLLSFIDPSTNSYHLVFDEIRNLLNLSDGERALSQAYQLSHELRRFFVKQTFFSTQPTNSQHLLFQQKIARLLINGERG